MVATSDVSALWQWPWTMMQAQTSLMEIWASTPVVMAARLPMIATAIHSPATANARELTRMVAEKSSAFTSSHRSMTSTGRAIQVAGQANARDLSRLWSGSLFWPMDYMKMADRNIRLFTTMVASPGAALAPIHQRVTANARRLGR